MGVRKIAQNMKGKEEVALPNIKAQWIVLFQPTRWGNQLETFSVSWEPSHHKLWLHNSIPNQFATIFATIQP